jgi:hypothetical protein
MRLRAPLAPATGSSPSAGPERTVDWDWSSMVRVASCHRSGKDAGTAGTCQPAHTDRPRTDFAEMRTSPEASGLARARVLLTCALGSQGRGGSRTPGYLEAGVWHYGTDHCARSNSNPTPVLPSSSPSVCSSLHDLCICTLRPSGRLTRGLGPSDIVSWKIEVWGEHRCGFGL